MGTAAKGEAASRSVSLYWCEKLWLVLDGLQLLAILLSAIQPSLPYGWNVWARLTSLFLLDITGLLRPLPTTNELGEYPLDASGRALVLVLLVVLAAAAAAAWPRAVYALELFERKQEIEKMKKKQELQRLRRPSQARPSVTGMLAISLNPAPPTFVTRCRSLANKLWKFSVDAFYRSLGTATKLRAAVTLFLLPAFLAIEVPLIFCSDQADACSSASLLLTRIASLAALSGLVYHAVWVLLRDMHEAAVARQGTQQEEYLKQREIEYLLFINNHWMEKKTWVVSSFKGGVFCSYFRLWLLLLKAALIVSSSLLGQVGSRPPTGLGWLASLGSSRDEAAVAAAAAKAASGTLAQAIAAEPLGEGARTAAAAGLVLLFCLVAVISPPYRCTSTNCIHFILFAHLGGISGIGLAAAGADAKRNSFLLYSNQHILLAVVHLCSFCLLLVTATCCCLSCLMPKESPLLQRYEAMMGYKGGSSSYGGADGRATVASLCHNLSIVCRHLWKRCVSRWCGNSSESSSSSTSSDTSCSTLELGEREIREKEYNLRPFEAPWPTRPQHARFWIRVAPHLVEQLATSSLLLQRYAAAEKQLLPVHLATAAFKELEALVVNCIGVVENRHTGRKSKCRPRTKTEDDQRALERLMQELGGGQNSRAQKPGDVGDSAVCYEAQKEESREGKMIVLRQLRPEQEESSWSVDSSTEAVAASEAVPHALAFRQLEKAAHLSAEFPDATLKELQDLKTIIKAVEWTVAEVFEKMSAIRAAAAAQSIWKNSAPPPQETQRLLHDFALHLKRRKRQMILLQPVRKRILLKLLAIRFITNTQKQREKREKEKKQHMADLFGEESSILFFSPNGCEADMVFNFVGMISLNSVACLDDKIQKNIHDSFSSALVFDTVLPTLRNWRPKALWLVFWVALTLTHLWFVFLSRLWTGQAWSGTLKVELRAYPEDVVLDYWIKLEPLLVVEGITTFCWNYAQYTQDLPRTTPENTLMPPPTYAPEVSKPDFPGDSSGRRTVRRRAPLANQKANKQARRSPRLPVLPV